MGILTILLSCILVRTVMAADAQLAIRIDSSGSYMSIELENSLFKAVMRTNQGAACGVEHAIRDWILKPTGDDQVDDYIDACAQRGPMKRAAVVFDGEDRKTLHAEYEDCSQDDKDNSAIVEYTVFANSLVMKVDYLKYPDPWANTVDIGTPGGAGSGEYGFFGQQEYATKVRPFIGHPESYWNTYDGGKYAGDPLDAGPLNYKGHLIMVVGNPQNGHGFGRVMPVFSPEVRGGVRIVKLLFNRGFETFPRTGQSFAPAYTGYLFLFEDGLGEAVHMGQRIVDGEMVIGPLGPGLSK